MAEFFSGMHGLFYQQCGPLRDIPNTFLQKKMFACSKIWWPFMLFWSFCKNFCQSQVKSQILVTLVAQHTTVCSAKCMLKARQHQHIGVKAEKDCKKTPQNLRKPECAAPPFWVLAQTALLWVFLPLGENTISSEANMESFKQSLLTLHEFPSSVTSSMIILAYHWWRTHSEEKKERKGELPGLNLESWLYPFILFTLWHLSFHIGRKHIVDHF